MNFLRSYKNERKKEVASDILVILVIIKFTFEYVKIHQSELSGFLLALLIFFGTLALAMKLSIFRNLLSVAALLIFLIDLLYQSDPASLSLFIILTMVTIASYFWLRLFQ